MPILSACSLVRTSVILHAYTGVWSKRSEWHLGFGSCFTHQYDSVSSVVSPRILWRILKNCMTRLHCVYPGEPSDFRDHLASQHVSRSALGASLKTKGYIFPNALGMISPIMVGNTPDTSIIKSVHTCQVFVEFHPPLSNKTLESEWSGYLSNLILVRNFLMALITTLLNAPPIFREPVKLCCL